jgi:hypothetical protein
MNVIIDEKHMGGYIWKQWEYTTKFNCTSIIEIDQNVLPNPADYPHSIKHLQDKNISLAWQIMLTYLIINITAINDEGSWKQQFVM